jgi:two-component system, sensor histidine kinase and response regulator
MRELVRCYFCATAKCCIPRGAGRTPSLDTRRREGLRFGPVLQSKKLKILVVDDNAENLALAQATLEDEGYDVCWARNGEQAIDQFVTEAPDCVLLDIRMPGMDGFAVCDRIRAMSVGQVTPIVFLTALRDVDVFDRALRAGADDFLTKPIRPTELAVRVHTALKLGRMSAELREVYELVKKQRDDLMRLQLQKDQMSAFIVHDLKNPASSMDLHAQLILRDPQLSSRARESTLRIRDEVRHLVRLIMNLLDVSKSERNQLVPKLARVDLEALMREVAVGLELKARATNVTLVRELRAVEARADADLLRRVLENLVDNALRHAPEGSVISVTSFYGEQTLEIRVRDAGTGISPALREKVFEPFIQLEHGERTVTRSGRGLGLAFCKMTIEAHAGSIWIEDAEPGAVFCVRLPHARD